MDKKKMTIGAAAAFLAALVIIMGIPSPSQNVLAGSYPDLDRRISIYENDYAQYAIYMDDENETRRDEFCLYNPTQCLPEPYESAFTSQLDLLYPMPSDFLEIKSMRAKGLIKYSSDRINEDYWLQPEWESAYEEGVKTMLGYQFGRYSQWCIFAFPSTHVVEISKQEGAGIQDIAIPIWVRSMWRTDKYNGFRVNYMYPSSEKFQGSSGVSYGEFTVEQDPELAKQYITIKAEPDGNLVVGPNFPVFHVADDPKYKLQLMTTVSIDPSIPAGDYVVGMDFGAPEKDFSEGQYLKYTYRKYNDPYSGALFCGARGFRLFIRVTE